MTVSFRLVCELEALTPMFLGGARQHVPELRAPSIKGAMRFWYRAADPQFRRREPLYFGAAGDGEQGARQSRLMVRCRSAADLQTLSWNDIRGQQGQRSGRRGERLSKDDNRQVADGLVYLGYPFGMSKNKEDDSDPERRAIRPGTRFTLEVSCHRAVAGDDVRDALRAALASIWCLGHFGGLGSRSRRGFGAVALRGWRLEDRGGAAPAEATELAALPLLTRTANAAEWAAGARRGIAVLRGWFGEFPDDRRGREHPCFGPEAELVVLSSHGRDDWRGALRALGQKLQEFRHRRSPDYQQVKDHLRFENGEGGRRIEQAPDRATFGLPLTFRYSSLPKGWHVTLVPTDGERHGSLLFLRPVLASSGLLASFLRLDGLVPGIDTRVATREPSRSLKAAEHNALDVFMTELKGKER